MEHLPPQSYPLPKRTTKRTRSALPDLDGVVQAVAKMHGTTRSNVADIMEINPAGLYKLLSSRKPKVDRLMQLCEALQYNFFDIYMRQLPEHLRTTTETKLLARQIQTLQQEKEVLQQKLEAVERERDLLLSIVKKEA
ncbi:MAG: hypothetical protein GC178_07095 [Flavobacteriales bacterium]|nr:hypothetical protein [Flavobacteriales bacterium]